MGLPSLVVGLRDATKQTWITNQTLAVMLRIAPFRNLLTHFRYLLTLRSQEGTYRSLILFRLAPNINIPTGNGDAESQQLYIMEANCPHLGADMSHADIEEVPDSVAPESGIVAVCPWHRYDFDLKTGRSETGLNACTYGVQIRADDAGEPDVFMETPRDGTAWRLVELRPVSEGDRCSLLVIGLTL